MSWLTFRNHPATVRVTIVLGVAAVGWMGHRAYGWPGLALVAGGGVMWALLHTTRMLAVLRRAAQRPIGTVASAVMLHSRLEHGMTLLQVLALTRSLGMQTGDRENPVAQYRWTDPSDATVHCTFEHGKLARWELLRP